MSAIVEGIDLDLILDDLAHTKKRVAELEDNQEYLVKFLRRAFPKKANQLTRLLREPGTGKKTAKPTTAFMQEDEGLSTENAVAQCLLAKPVSSDPILSKVGIESTREKFELSDCLRG